MLADPSTMDKPSDLSQEEWDGWIDTAVLDCAAHASLIRDFALVAQVAGHSINVPDYLLHLFHHSNPVGAQSYMTRFFNGRNLETGEQEHPRMAPIFAIAQHHGVPTGLMDWSDNPLVAAYFAAASVTREIPREDKSICVYAIHTSAFVDNHLLKSYPVPPGIVRFLDAQAGLFSWCPMAYHQFLRAGQYPTLDEVVQLIASSIQKPAFIKITLPQVQASDLLKALWRERVSLAHLMPTFDNVYQALLVQSQWYERIAVSSI